MEWLTGIILGISLVLFILTLIPITSQILFEKKTFGKNLEYKEDQLWFTLFIFLIMLIIHYMMLFGTGD